MSTPTVFLSAASDDLKDWREVLHQAFERAGFKVFTQKLSFGASSGDVLQLLRLHLDKSDFVIHLAGLAYGAEPEQPAFPDRPDFHCSYTQFEYYYAHQQGKQVIALVCAPDFPYLAFTEKGVDDADRERRRLLQDAHRQRVTDGYFTDTPLDAHPTRPLSEGIADAKTLLVAVSAAVGTIREAASSSASAPVLAAVQEDLTELAKALTPIEISRMIKYAPAELIGREAETQLLNDAWDKAVRGEPKRPHILTFVALGGEGKTSLVAKWVADLAFQDWPGCDAAFAWSFYSQGTREQTAVSSDLFLSAALNFFGDKATAESALGAHEKGLKLAQLVGERRALLILDGLEPLQYAPTSPTPGELKDQGLAALLKGLAGNSKGLCVVTTRYAIPDVRAFFGKSVIEEKLTRLSTEAGVALLRSFGVHGSLRKNIPSPDGHMQWNEFEKLVEDVKGHALTLNLLGSFLRDAHAGDIRRRDLIKLEEADAEEQSGHAFHVMDAYVRSLENRSENEEGNAKGQRALALLRLLGLFDRPATADCLEALWKGEAIAELTEPLIDSSEAQRNISLKRLEDARLLTVNRDASHQLVSLDAHPLLREYFAQRLREQQPEAWRAAHRRLYEHLCTTTHEGDQPTLEDLQPLYQAVAHGCQAGLQKDADHKVYDERIMRGDEHYGKKKLGAHGSNLGAIACFFESPWSRVSPTLTAVEQAWLLNEAAFSLRALGRLTEALEPMRAGLENYVNQENWHFAAITACNVSELEVTLGEVAGALRDAEQSVTYADRSGDAFQRESNRSAHADALHHAGRRDAALARFREAENIRVQRQPAHPLLYGLSGFGYCDLLSTEAERAAWQGILECGRKRQRDAALDATTPVKDPANALSPLRSETALQSCRAVSERAKTALQIVLNGSRTLLDIALNHLTLGRAALYAAVLSSDSPSSSVLAHDDEVHSSGAVPVRSAATSHLESAVSGLRRAGTTHHIPRGLLTRAWLRFLEGKHTGTESAQSDLDEAWEIAERGPMPLFLADIHLYRARLFHAVKPYPWAIDADGNARGPKDDLAAARKLIESCGYWRRKEELEDAEAAAENW